MVCKSQEMPTLQIPNDASIHTLKNFLSKNSPFDRESPAKLIFHPKWAYMDPLALAATAAWGGWCQRHGIAIEVENFGHHVNYPARMQLFKHLGVKLPVELHEHEESGRFMPLARVNSAVDLATVIADISALLHLEKEPEGLAAVQYCVSELIRNVLEHSGSTDGAYVCAQRYFEADPKRVSIAVADCGGGIADHLGNLYPEARDDDREALRLAMTPGVTGAQAGMYGSTDNAGAGLFITSPHYS
jgi:anti-sigma regulatory factor (Ser/Thr protein kinase)